MGNVLQSAQMLDRARKALGAGKLRGIESELEAILAAEYPALEAKAMEAAQTEIDQANRLRAIAEEEAREARAARNKAEDGERAALVAKATAEAALQGEKSARKAAEQMAESERQRRQSAESALERRTTEPPALKVEMPATTPQSYAIDINRGPDGLMKSLTVTPR